MAQNLLDEDDVNAASDQTSEDSAAPSDDASASVDQGSPSPAPQLKPPSPSDATQYAVTPEDLQQAQDTKRKLALIAGLTNSFSNMKGAGSIMLGNNSKFDVNPILQPLMDQADQNIKNKQTLQSQAMKLPEMKYVAQAQDPGSDISKASAAQHKAMLLGVADVLGKNNPDLAKSLTDAAGKMDGMSAFDQTQLMDKTGLSKIASADTLAGLKNQQMMLALAQKVDYQNRRLGIQQDNQTNKVADTFDNDSLMRQYSGQVGQIQKAQQLLNSNGPITHQSASELSQDLATILSNGRAAGLEQANKQEYNSLAGLSAQIDQWVTNHPKDALPEEFRQQLADQFVRLNQGVMNARSLRAQTMAQGRNYQFNPAANSMIQNKTNEYTGSGGGLPVQNAQAGQGTYDDQDKSALDWAQANPKDPRAIQILMKLHKKGSM